MNPADIARKVRSVVQAKANFMCMQSLHLLKRPQILLNRPLAHFPSVLYPSFSLFKL